MNIKSRRIIMFSFISAFFILAPILIFYASGYRYDLKRHKIIKTGTLMLEAKNLNKANLYLNDKLYEKPFDEKIFVYNLLPGEYTVKLSKEGYHPWQKKITISSSLTTFEKDIILFQNNVPLQIIDGQIVDFSLSPDYQKIVYTNLNGPFSELYLFDLTLNEKKLLYRIPANAKIFINWAPSSKKILLKVDSDFLIFEQQNFVQALEIKDILNFNPTITKWDIQSDNLLYALKQNKIYKIDLLSKTSQVVFNALKETIKPEFFVEGNDLFYIQEAETENILYKYNFNFKTTKKILAISKANDYQFSQSVNNFLGLLDSDQQKYYLIKKINTGQEINILLEEPIREFTAKAASWDINEKKLLLYDDFEINTFDVGNNEKVFVNRYGQVIKKAAWYPDLQHIVILFENNLQIIDLTDDNNSHNSTEIIKYDHLDNFYLDDKGENIYFNGQIGKQQGLYQLKLK